MENNTIGKVLFTEEQIRQRAAELGKQISEDYAGEEIYLVGTLKGAVMWMGDLMKHITNDTQIDFVVASSYGSGTTSSGVVKVKKDLDGDIYGKNVIIIDIKIIDGQNGLFIAMPSRKVGEGDFRDVAHPLKSETRAKIKDAIFAEYDRLCEEEPVTVAEEEPLCAVVGE